MIGRTATPSSSHDRENTAQDPPRHRRRRPKQKSGVVSSENAVDNGPSSAVDSGAAHDRITNRPRRRNRKNVTATSTAIPISTEGEGETSRRIQNNGLTTPCSSTNEPRVASNQNRRTRRNRENQSNHHNGSGLNDVHEFSGQPRPIPGFSDHQPPPANLVSQKNMPKRSNNKSRRAGGKQQDAPSFFNPNATPFVPAGVEQSREYNAFPRRFTPKYVPAGAGQKPLTRNRSNQQVRPRRVRNDADDQDKPLRERLMNQLEDNNYECMICCQVVYARQSIWSCGKCFHMFHISGGCIVNWAKKSKEDDNKWRCPTCQTKYEPIPYNYYCFCGKERNPVTHMGETPHSCGNVCGGQRGPGCVHPCSEPCHPGPCPECPVMLTKSCSCGSVVKAVRCGTNIKVSCEKVCDRVLSCGEHSCSEVCHDGPCKPCDVRLEEDCFCGASKREVVCSATSQQSAGFSCGQPCEGMYKCGKHHCESNCHAGDCGSCPRSPDRISRCPCGRSTLEALDVVRTSCDDVIPTCQHICDKVLQCGSAEKPHRCRSKCHNGPCPPCDFNTSIVCRCRQVKRTLPCKEYLQFAGGEQFLCEKRCRKKKSCGVHKCQEMCCVQQEHYCMQICNKRLSCGLHNCENICHSGQCPRCLNASFEEQFCHCGRTMRPPPIPCGAALPECDEPCARAHACQHPVNHRCHSDQNCPPCTFLVERMCYGKHEVRKNIPCHMEAVSCGRICNLPLPCGAHSCNRNCHSGSCVKEGEKCRRACPVLRHPCEHACALACHSTDPCPPSQCNQLVEVMCSCGRKKTHMKCHEVEKSRARLRAVLSEGEREDNHGAPTAILKRSSSMEKLTCISCTDDCKKVARNKRLADALSIVTNDDGDTDEPTITFTETMKAELKTSPQFVLEIENVFTGLLEALGDATNCNNVISHNFRPMPMERRRFVHEYSDYFHMDTVSVDEAPKRSVIVTAKRGNSRAPLILLSDLHKYPGVLKALGPTTLRSNVNEDIKKAAAAAAAAEAVEEGMKSLRLEKKVYKRVAPTIAKPAPIRQQNAFALLGSDVEDEGEALESRAEIDWWCEETEKVEADREIEADVPEQAESEESPKEEQSNEEKASSSSPIHADLSPNDE